MYHLQEITEGLVFGDQIDTNFKTKTILCRSDSLADFFRLGAGYCVVLEDKAVAMCYASFVVDQHHWSIGVDTHQDYRKRGFAKAATKGYCQVTGLAPYWDYLETNTASRKLAQHHWLPAGFHLSGLWFLTGWFVKLSLTTILPSESCLIHKGDEYNEGIHKCRY